MATIEELDHYLNQWLGPSGRRMPSYRMGMFAFHGDKDFIHLGKYDITLHKLPT